MRLIALATFALLLAAPVFADAPSTKPAAGANAKPSPDLSPADVVKVVLDALKHNDRPMIDQGIKVAFRFASPDNKRATGPIDRFLDLVKNPQYRPLIDHKSFEAGEMKIDGTTAMQPVKVRAADGTTATYLFQLSKQPDGAFKGCWMTDGVIRLDPPNPPMPGGMA